MAKPARFFISKSSLQHVSEQFITHACHQVDTPRKQSKRCALHTAVLALTCALALPNGAVAQSGFVSTRGGKLFLPDGTEWVPKGVNLGGWLVTENWLCGITDSEDVQVWPVLAVSKRMMLAMAHEDAASCLPA